MKSRRDIDILYSKRTTRIELKASCGTTCSFSVDLDYSVSPCVGDVLFFEADKPFTAKVLYVCHYFLKCGHIIITSQVECLTYDDLLVKLDWFKANYTLCDIKSDECPQSYYMLYRLVLRLLGRSKETDPKIMIDQTSIKIFAELCRAILITEFKVDDGLVFNQAILDLHTLILSKKHKSPNGIEILPIIKEWEYMVNRDGNMKWDRTIEQYQQAARFVFSKLKSVSSDRLPTFGEHQ